MSRTPFKHSLLNHRTPHPLHSSRVEERYWYCREGQYAADPQELVDLVDENTILVCAILGTTYTGEYEDVEKINDLLEKKNKETGLDVHIHVDAASGGFGESHPSSQNFGVPLWLKLMIRFPVAPFVRPDLKWDFRNSLVCSINTSGWARKIASSRVARLRCLD